MPRPVHLLVAALLAVSITTAVAPVAAEPTTVIGTDGTLASDAAGVEYRETGNVSVGYAAPDVTVTATQTAADCGVERDGAAGVFGFLSDTRNDYLCIQHNESVARTYQIYVTDRIWAGYERETVEPEVGDTPASFQGKTIDDTRYLFVTVTLDEAGMYAYPVNRESTFLAERVDRHRDRVENVTGVGVATDTEWRHVNPDAYSNESTYVLQAPNGTDDLLLEYETESGWEVVPEGEQAYAPVYYQQVSETEVLVLASGKSEPPRLRYTEDPATSTMFDSFWREASTVPDRISEFLSGLGGG